MIDTIFSFIILIFAVVIHEVSHGYMAFALGDRTAKDAGRLTLNPVRHIDWFGSIFLPLLLVLTKAGFIIGWAKPVPYNAYNLRNQRWGEFWVSFAGPLSNLSIAVLFGLILRFSIMFSLFSIPFLKIISFIVVINLVLGFFNLLPIPPLDGSKILFSFFPNSLRKVKYILEEYGMIIVLLFIVFLWSFLFPLVTFSFKLLTGTSF